MEDVSQECKHLRI